MKTACKILFISLLSFKLPVGRLTDVFCWRRSICKIESVFKQQSSAINARTCFFKKAVVKYLRSIRNTIREKQAVHAKTTEDFIALKNQINTSYDLKNLLIRQIISSKKYPDVPLPAFVRSQ